MYERWCGAGSGEQGVGTDLLFGNMPLKPVSERWLREIVLQ